jgi:hypothetical protein
MNKKEKTYRLMTENFKNKLNEAPDTINQILPRMVQISNNSRITQAVAQAVIDKFSPEEFSDFLVWLSIIERNK